VFNPFNPGSEMTPQQQVLANEVYLPTFINKCAELGVNFQDEEDLQAALRATAILRSKAQSDTSSVIKQASAFLAKQTGLDVQEQQQASLQSVKAAAAKAAQSQNVRQAVASMLQQPAA
jgi:hypothetical protein